MLSASAGSPSPTSMDQDGGHPSTKLTQGDMVLGHTLSPARCYMGASGLPVSPASVYSFLFTGFNGMAGNTRVLKERGV